MAKQRISYFPLDKMDAEMQKEMDRCRREGTPRPESSAIRAHVKACFWFFANSWRDLFRNGVLEHPIKELCRLYISRSVQCDYCGNQRSVKAAGAGMIEDDVKDLLNFEKSKRYDERQKAALAYAEAIAWHIDTDDAFWERMHKHFSEPELVELGCFIALTMGQQAGCACSTSITTRCSPAPRRRWRRDTRPPKSCSAPSPIRSTGRGRSAHENLPAGIVVGLLHAGGGAGVSVQADQDHRSVHAGQRDRRHGAHRRRAPQRSLGPAGHRGEQARRGRHHRHPRHRARRSGRLHAGAGVRRTRR
jgi:alkylhydroperoxidase family enzyme